MSFDPPVPIVEEIEESAAPSSGSWSELIRTEDWWAIWLGAIILTVGWWTATSPQNTTVDGKTVLVHPLARFVANPAAWKSNPLDAIFPVGKPNLLPALAGALVIGLALFGVSTAVMGERFSRFAVAFVGVFALAVSAFLLAGQTVVKYYGLEYALWALAVGLIISNTVGAPAVLRPAVRTEFYIKTGLVLLGAEILFGQLVKLGAPGIGVSWLVTPVVLFSTYQFGQRVLRMESKTLNLVISADMSVCGVSAAIATGAACRAKKEEISLAIGLSLAFTVVMMVVQPWIIKATGMSEVLGGAWLGGTIDSTGAVAAAGALLGKTAETVAITVKMIQNILIGVVAFVVAVLWVTVVEPNSAAADKPRIRPSLWEIWIRFPKFILGFIAASIVFTLLASQGASGAKTAELATKGFSVPLRGWFFCLAFVSIGLETNFRSLMGYFRGGKPVVLYVVGQTLNLCLTLVMAYLMFEVLFPDAARELAK